MEVTMLRYSFARTNRHWQLSKKLGGEELRQDSNGRTLGQQVFDWGLVARASAILAIPYPHNLVLPLSENSGGYKWAVPARTMRRDCPLTQEHGKHLIGQRVLHPSLFS